MSFIRHIKNVASFMQLPRESRRIVFYSEGRAYWPHLEGLLKACLSQSHIPICYITSADNNPGLDYQHPHLNTFKIDEGWIRNWFFANIDTDILLMTMPDLQCYQVKRSRYPVHYVYVQHSLVSAHMAYRPGAFDHFDTIFCAGPHHQQEIRALEALHHLPQKHLVPHGYGRLDAILKARKNNPAPHNMPPHILIAPSWANPGLIETLGSDIIEHLLNHQYQVTLRPHPQTFTYSKKKLQTLAETYKHSPHFSLDEDTASQKSLQACDLMISDWSGAALDYAFGLEKPVLFIDTPKKINNPQYQEIALEPFEISIRKKIGSIVSPADITKLDETIKTLLSRDWHAIMMEERKQHVFNIEKSAQVGAAYILELVK